jgi:hypothetical protein
MMKKQQLRLENVEVESFVTDEASPTDGTVFAQEEAAAAAPTQYEICTKPWVYSCDGKPTCSGIETCDGDLSCPEGCDFSRYDPTCYC